MSLFFHNIGAPKTRNQKPPKIAKANPRIMDFLGVKAAISSVEGVPKMIWPFEKWPDDEFVAPPPAMSIESQTRVTKFIDNTHNFTFKNGIGDLFDVTTSDNTSKFTMITRFTFVPIHTAMVDWNLFWVLFPTAGGDQIALQRQQASSSLRFVVDNFSTSDIEIASWLSADRAYFDTVYTYADGTNLEVFSDGAVSQGTNTATTRSQWSGESELRFAKDIQNTITGIYEIVDLFYIPTKDINGDGSYLKTWFEDPTNRWAMYQAEEEQRSQFISLGIFFEGIDSLVINESSDFTTEITMDGDDSLVINEFGDATTEITMDGADNLVINEFGDATTEITMDGADNLVINEFGDATTEITMDGDDSLVINEFGDVATEITMDADDSLIINQFGDTTTEIIMDVDNNLVINEFGDATTEITMVGSDSLTINEFGNITTEILLDVSGTLVINEFADFTAANNVLFEANVAIVINESGQLTTEITMSLADSLVINEFGDATTEITMDADDNLTVNETSNITNEILMRGTDSLIVGESGTVNTQITMIGDDSLVINEFGDVATEITMRSSNTISIVQASDLTNEITMRAAQILDITDLVDLTNEITFAVDDLADLNGVGDITTEILLNAAQALILTQQGTIRDSVVEFEAAGTITISAAALMRGLNRNLLQLSSNGSNTAGEDLLLVIDTVPSNKKITIDNIFSTIPSNTNFLGTADLVSLFANNITSSNTTINGTLIANNDNIQIKNTFTPTSNIATDEIDDDPAGSLLWDANYLYLATSNGTIKRLDLNDF